MTEKEAYIALNMVKGIGAITVANGIARFGSAVAFFSAGERELAEVRGLNRSASDELSRTFATLDWQGEITHAKKLNVAFLTPADPEYPALLKNIYNPPLTLYVTGSVEALNTCCLGIVGTRAPTTYGRTTAKSFANRLAQAGVTIVSGLARGIDTEAHAGALLGKGRTVAVIGSALDRLYPAENRDLARRIVAEGGAVISEYPFGRSADRQTFPMRNRIISGLSNGVLVIEAGVASGTLITVDHALEQGRSVMAVPGRIDTENAKGCHKLIKDGARLVENPNEVLDELQSLACAISAPQQQLNTATNPQPKPRPQAILDDIETQILEHLGTEEMTPDALVNASGLSPAVIGPRLISLEMKCRIERCAGNTLKIRNF